MTHGLQLAHPNRRRAAAALAAAVVAAVAAVITLVRPAVAAPPPATAPAAGSAALVTAGAPAAGLVAGATVTTSAGGVSLTVDPAGGLTAAGATLKVTGTGFKTANGLYVAICHANGKAPASLQDCVGGPIPGSNTSLSWAHITAKGSGAGPAGSGPVVAAWSAGGGFAVNLQLPPSNSASDALDCSQVACAVYTTPDSGQDQTQNLSVPLSYAASTSASSSPTTSSSPSSSSSSSSSAPSSSTPSSSPTVSSPVVVTSTLAGAPTTVAPKTIRSPSVQAGDAQEVLFAGFQKGEIIAVTLDRTALAAVRADSDGIVKVDFVVPKTTPAGTHLLRVVGKATRTSGVASFVVTAAPVSSAPVSSAPVSSAPASSAVPSSAPVSSAVVLPPVSSAPLSTPSSAPVSSSVPPPVVAPTSATGSKPVWPWYVLGLVVLLWIGFALYMWQRRHARLAAEMAEKERILAEGAAAEQDRAAEAIARANADAPTAYIGPTAAEATGGYLGYHPGEHGLLSGRDNPDNPGLLAGHGYQGEGYQPAGEQPTSYLPSAPGAVGGPPTGAWTPDFTQGPGAGGPPSGSGAAATDPGPGTAQWLPGFDDEPAEEPDAPGTDGPESGGHGTTPPGGRHSR